MRLDTKSSKLVGKNKARRRIYPSVGEFGGRYSCSYKKY